MVYIYSEDGGSLKTVLSPNQHVANSALAKMPRFILINTIINGFYILLFLFVFFPTAIKY